MNLIDKRDLINNKPEMLNPNMNDEIESAYNKGWNACNSEWISLLDDDPSEMVLIDKNKLLKELRKYHPISYGILSDIEYFPTSYDVDKVIEQLEELEKEHPYKVIGQPDTYSQYNEAWRDCIDRVLNIVKRGGVENDG